MIVGLLTAAARAEVFLLHNDGQIRGEVLNKDESPRKTYVVKTASGGQVTLTLAQIKQVLHQLPGEIEYDRIRSRFPDTVAGQWDLAQWCLKNHLSKQRKVHLERIIGIEPNHVEARRALGYTQIQGEWVTQEQRMTENGYVRYKGSWRLPQEVELMEKKSKDDLAAKEWVRKLKRWRDWLDNGNKSEQAKANIAGIKDPYAAKALARGVAEEERRDVKFLFIDSLARLRTPDALDALAKCSMEDPDEESRIRCLDRLVAEKYRAAVGLYVQRLKSKDNIMVNRAAVALSYMQDPSSIGPLIDALSTTHSYKVVKGQPGQMSSSFGTGGGSPGGFSFGGGGTEIIKQKIANQPVLDALISLTKANFGFDTHAWKHWYAAQKKSSTVNIRRD